MEILKLKKEEDLEMVRSLVEHKEYLDSDDIVWDRSIKCIANNGDLLGFALVKPNSLIDFIGGEIPAEEGVSEERKYRRRERIHSLENNQYEVVFYVKEIGDSYIESDDLTEFGLQYELSTNLEIDKDGHSIEQVLWSRYKLPKFIVGYKPYNNICFINFPIVD